ncbi:hypothetical protein L596_007151 [Steinernema carpocapsae]|uniref:5-formyltetrahydrofolate cyclo-ligase n=1 Tax=Steinernema carpocapsae TaxID=34508 RepID=A0A4U5P948_STECR|nr:hypothetical protein L596_007151 [Steinernema carpocapsae]
MPSTDDVKMAKKALRTTIANLLKTVSEDSIKRETEAVTQKIFNSEWFRNAQRISVYVNTEGEIETDAIILKALELKKDVFVPRFKRGQRQMEMLKLENALEFAKLDTTLWGIRQHHPDLSPLSYKDYGALDLVVMPGVAFTTSGLRLGHGKGFYDQFLHEHKQLYGKFPTTVGLALQAQMVDTLPTSEYDVQLDQVYRAT